MIKVFLGGEGNNELGSRWQEPMGEEPGVVEALLRKVRAGGWRVDGAVAWKALRKYQAGAARGTSGHADGKNVVKLVIQAYERACEVLAFVRDDDGDPDRAEAIDEALAAISARGFAEGYRYELGVIGGVARPSIEGWILQLRTGTATDERHRGAVDDALTAAGVELKATAAYVAVVAVAPRPRGVGSLPAWLDRAEAVLGQAIDGVRRA
jgi:hypothetical protein